MQQFTAAGRIGESSLPFPMPPCPASGLSGPPFGPVQVANSEGVCGQGCFVGFGFNLWLHRSLWYLNRGDFALREANTWDSSPLASCCSIEHGVHSGWTGFAWSTRYCSHLLILLDFWSLERLGYYFEPPTKFWLNLPWRFAMFYLLKVKLPGQEF